MLADQMKMRSSRVIKSATPDLTLSSKRDLNNGPRLRAGMSGSGLRQASQQCFTMSAFGSEGSRTRYSDKATVSAVIADPFLFSVRCPDRCAKNEMRKLAVLERRPNRTITHRDQTELPVRPKL